MPLCRRDAVILATALLPYNCSIWWGSLSVSTSFWLTVINLRASADEVNPTSKLLLLFWLSAAEIAGHLTRKFESIIIQKRILPCRFFPFFLYFVLTIFLHSLRSSNNLKLSFITPPITDFKRIRGNIWTSYRGYKTTIKHKKTPIAKISAFVRFIVKL